MSEYKNKVIFSSDKVESTSSSSETSRNESEYAQAQETLDKLQRDHLGAKVTFDSQTEFVPMTQAQQREDNEVNALEDDMVNIIRPKSKRRWWVASGVAAFTGLLGWQSVHNVVVAYQQGDWLSLGWTGLIAALASVGIVFTVKELWKLRRLRRQLNHQEEAFDLIQSHGTGKGVPFCENLAEQAGVTLEHVGFDRWKKTVNANHNDADVIELYDSMVIAQQDKQAKKLVATYSTEAAVLVAVSPLAIADMFLVAWRNFKMIDELGKVYGVELGYWSRIRLLKLVFINMAAAGASELIADVGMNVMSMNVAGKISTRAAQGIGVGMLTGQLGIKAMALLRPLPWHKDKAVRLSEIRKLVVGRVIGKSQDKES
ncbi:YcjF family protein [Vibrio rumoiensis]|uniref:TIGR01620 family protein n=1 Tax=Vibrio rumoiensis 1S-45 TaxID=1188252 RepID=A0A1E5E5Q0_9VIBR|nr:TIGR01620 family protein [Vibrio rumoiensis]OEF29220.1 TIGR01620 family protein [Vibrio rumoiensis 1S-45]